MIQNIEGIKFNRAVVPDDAISLDINTTNTGDASHHLEHAQLYMQDLNENQVTTHVNSFSAELIPQGMSQPRAELFAATLNAHTR